MHPTFSSDAYNAEELAEMRGLIAAYPDAWRQLHPREKMRYTVWDEKTNARAFNKVSSEGQLQVIGLRANVSLWAAIGER